MDQINATKAAGLALFGGLFLTGLGLAMPRQRWAKNALRVGGSAVAVGTGLALVQYVRTSRAMPEWAAGIADKLADALPVSYPTPQVVRPPSGTSWWTDVAWQDVSADTPGVYT